MQQEILTTARMIAEEAGAYALEVFHDRNKLQIGSKGLLDYVSEADCEVERRIRQALSEAFPEHGFKGEETGGELTPPCWVIDPIDGTTNYLYGRPDFCISMAFVDEQGPAIAVVHAPFHRRTIYAARGIGAFEDGKRLRPRQACDHELVVNLCFNYKQENNLDFLNKVNRLVSEQHQIRICGSAAWALCQAATGQVDGAYNGCVNSWDVLGGQLICAEAGLEVGPYVYEQGSVYAYPKGSVLSDILVPYL
ncbi:MULTISPECIES: inositol monophosphatase [unclassified Pseudovibrio]|uniref:inositol monophosphatase family protein n=1 Tax=unclassified Pseudovibrio TaxID=2627060 RepID=UPI0007AE8269|nr:MULTISPECIES: inositol monophosphatase [unclassified Pseudovibrio]KZL03012.1 Inositol-1-monophosphatase [Pseudovibrio sp. W74]KZL04969.1 Inositol-1-monophosphatase [Pseudovibrio sp. Ad14]